MTPVAPPPPFEIYVVWHPKYADGEYIATRLRRHFATGRDRSIYGGTGVPVLYRNSNAPGSEAPLPIDWDHATETAVVVLIDGTLMNDHSWVQYVQRIVHEARQLGSVPHIFPVVTEDGRLDVCQGIQALRWDRWAGNRIMRGERLIRDLIHEFIGMLQRRLTMDQSDATKDAMDYAGRVSIFLSHSSKDGGDVANAVRDWLRKHSRASSFLAPQDIPAGDFFGTVINNNIRNGAVAVIYTDSYSSREWCRREIIEAKRMNVPMVVVDCLESVDERSFPYMGNVPVVRMDPAKDAIPVAVGRLLDAAFRCLLWRCSVKDFHETSNTVFTAWPPELIFLASLRGDGTQLIVYPDPPLGTEEMDLFSDVDSNVRLLTLNQWRAGVQP